MPDPLPTNLVHDPQVLRAIAHPVRNRILAELDAQGSLRAADIARELDIPANQASFHLRQLAKYGLVEEDPDAARDKRDRVWRAVHDGGLTVNFQQLEAVPGGAAATAIYRRNATSWGQYVVQQAYQVEHEDEAARTARTVSETALRLTPAEARELTAEIGALLDRWGARTRADTATERSTYLYYAIVQPHPGRPDAAPPGTP